MSEQRQIKIPITGDSTGFKQAAEDVKGAARDMAQAVGQAGQQAGQGLAKIGDGAPAAAGKVDAATKSLIGSIQRTTAAMEAGSKSGSKYFEVLAAQRGVNVEVLRPYLQQLDAVTGKQVQATAALNAGAAGMANIGMSAKATAAALRGVPAQFTDIVTSIQGGQRPMTVLLQQGGQLKDMFGGAGAAARALGGYVLGLVGPVTIAAAAIGGIAYAAHQGGEELRAFQNATTITGNAIGLTNSQFGALRDSIGGIATQGRAAEVLTAIAASGLEAGANVKGIAEAAILMEKATGQAVSKTIEQFKELAKSPADASAKLNEQYNFLTASVYRQIKALEEQGRVTEAANLAERTYADALKTRAQSVVDNAGFMERAWRGITGAAKGAWDAMLGVGRQVSNTDQISILQRQLADRQQRNRTLGIGDANGDSAMTAEVKVQIDLLKENERMEKRLAESQAQRAQITRQTVEWEKQGDQFLTKQQQREKELLKAKTEGQALVNAGIITERELTERLNGIRQKYNETTGQSEVADIRAKTKAQQLENARLLREIANFKPGAAEELPQTEGDKLVIKLQEELKTGLLGVARAEKEKALAAAQALAVSQRQGEEEKRQLTGLKASEEAIKKQADAASNQADAIRAQAEQQEAANATLGKSKTAIEQLVLAQLKLQAAEADASDTFDPRYVAGLNAKVAAQERYVKALQDSEFKQRAQQLDEATRVSKEETTTLQLQMSLLGQTQEVRDRIIAQRKVEVELAKELAEIEKSGATDDRKEELRIKARAKAQIDTANAASKSVLDEWQRTADSINNSLTDALLRGFESGKGFAQNLRDTLKNMFSTLILRPIIQGVMAPISGAVSGAMSGLSQGIIGGNGSSIVSGGMGNIGSLFSAGSSMLGSGGIGSGGGMLGSLGMNSAGGAIDTIAGTFGMGSGIGGVAVSSAEAAGLAGATEAGLLGAGATAAEAAAASGALGASAAGVGAAGAAGGGLMAGAGAALAAIPVAGWIALAAIALYSMFGGKGGGQKQDGRFGLLGSGVAMYDSDLTAQNNQVAKKAAQGVQAQYDSLVKSFGGSGGIQYGLGFSLDPKGKSPTFLDVTASRDGKVVSNQTNLNVGRSQEELQAAIADMSARATLAGLQQSNLKGILGEYLSKLGDVAKLSADTVTEALARLQKAAAEKESLEATYFDLTHTAIEKLIATREKERAAIDESNRALYDQVALMQDLQATATAAAQAVDTARGALVGAYQRESAELQGVIDRHTNYAKQLRDLRDSLLLGDASPLGRSAKTAQAGTAFQSTLASAIGGNENALQGLGGAGQALLEAAKNSARSPVELAMAFARVQAGLTTAAASSDSKASVAQQQLDAMTQQLTALGVLNQSVVDVRTALAGYLQAMNQNVAAQGAIQQAQLAYLASIAAAQNAPAPTPAAVAQAEAGVPSNVVFVGPVTGTNYTYGQPVDPRDLPQELNYSGFATGGLASGVAMVGEKGPELVDFSTPGRVYTNDQTRGMFAPSDDQAALLRDVLAELKAARAEGRVVGVATVASLQKIEAIEKKREAIGMPPERATV